MSLKGLLFIGLFSLCSIGALFAPQIGIYGYVAEYCVGPTRAWWGAPFAAMGVRFSFTLVLATAVGMILQRKKLQFGTLLYGQEKLIIAFLGCIMLLVLFNGDISGLYTSVDQPSIKMVKVFIFVLMMTHVVTDLQKFDNLFWVFVSVSLLIGVQAWQAPSWQFVKGRIEGLGGADISGANFLAAFMASMLPIIGIQFLRSRLLGKFYCATAAAFVANTVVLCRSRGAILAILIGVIVSFFFSPKKYKKQILVLLIIGILGGIYVMDEQFINRGSTITQSGENRDSSAQSRLRLWRAGAKIISDHPLGIGAGNWFKTIGGYLPEYEGTAALDAHNTYVKSAAELGVQGGFVLALIIFSAFSQLRRVRLVAFAELSDDAGNDFILFSFALTVSLTIILMCGMTITMLYTEITWLLLLLPVCLGRALDNALLANKQ